MTKLELLYAQKAKKLDQLCAVAARELGLGDLAALSVQDRIRVDDQVEQYVEQWEETVEMRTGFTIRPSHAIAAASRRVSRHLRTDSRRARHRCRTLGLSEGYPEAPPSGAPIDLAARPGAPAVNAPGLPRFLQHLQALACGVRYFWSIHSPHQAALKVRGHSELAVGCASSASRTMTTCGG